MGKILKIILIVLGIFITLLLVFWIFLYIAFDRLFSGPIYNKSDLIENYENRKERILEVRDYYKSILPEDKTVYIEFGKGKDLKIFHVYGDSLGKNNWNLTIGTPKVDSLLHEVKWTHNELQILREKLDAANCISIAGYEPVVIGWQRSGMGLFSYDVFENSLSENQIAEYNEGCIHIFYKDNIVLEYGGGAIGMQCFPEYLHKKDQGQVNP